VESVRESTFVCHVAQTYVSQVLLLMVGVLTTVVVARALGPSGRGLYAVAMTVGALGVRFGNFGLQGSNTYYLAKDRTLLITILGNTIAASLLVGSGLSIGIWTFFQCLPRYAVLKGPVLAVGLLWIPVGLSYFLLRNLFLAVQKIKEYNSVEILNRVWTLLLVIGFIWLHRITVVNMLLAALAGQIAAAGYSYLQLSKYIDESPRTSLPLLRQHLSIGLKAYMVSFFGFLALRIDLLMVKQMLGPEQAGYYSIVANMADYVLVLPVTTAVILFPKLAELSNAVEKLEKTKSTAYVTAICLAVLLVISGLVAHILVKLLFGKAFLPAATAFLWLLPGIFTLGITTIVVQFLNSLGYPLIVVWIWFASTVLNISLNLFAIPHMGIAGASLVSSISYTATLLAVIAVVKFGWLEESSQPG
jgi:O-antigen/teichoic acid export membrane protein